MRYLIVSMLLLVGCQGNDPFADAKALASRDMKDPSSAQFREMKRQGPLICGEINAKNSYGAYAGFQPFLVWDGKAMVAKDGTELNDVLYRARITLACVDGDTSRMKLPPFED